MASDVPTNHFENHLRSNVSSAVSLITRLELKTTKTDFKMSLESESNIHNDGDNILNCSSYLEEIRIQSPYTCIILEQTISEKQFGQKKAKHGKVN